MGPQLRGGNLEEMHQMAKSYASNAKQLHGIITDLNSRTTGSDQIWTGPAAERFRTAWHEARSSFEKMRQALEEASSAINKHAQNIEAATR
ncbi:MAG: WXG100 family type VII secretion target [Labedaea sp.]|jgi:WXG100 family type VII secretion target